MDTVCPKGTQVATAKRKILQSSSCHSDAPCHGAILPKDGIEKFLKVGEEAVSKELLQLRMRDIFEPQDITKLSQEQKRVPYNPWCS
jgi:hypothetical protein